MGQGSFVFCDNALNWESGVYIILYFSSSEMTLKSKPIKLST